jgi:hypothetical protein
MTTKERKKQAQEEEYKRSMLTATRKKSTGP